MIGDRLWNALDELRGRRDPLPREVFEAVLDAYADDRGETLDYDTLTPEQRDRVSRYVDEASYRAAFQPRLTDLRGLPLYGSFGEKVNRLASRRCDVCRLADGPGARTFRVDVPPWSRQSSGTQMARDLRAALRAHPAADTFQPATGPVCMRAVFVLPVSSRSIDVDNLAKGLLDAFEGLLYVNDRLVDHLDLLRLKAPPGIAGSIALRIASTIVNDHSDVIDPSRDIRNVAYPADTLNIGQHPDV